jgi:hypothetical protein
MDLEANMILHEFEYNNKMKHLMNLRLSRARGISSNSA